MSEPTVIITKAEYDALQKVAEVWDKNVGIWQSVEEVLDDTGYRVTAQRYDDACNAMDSAVAEAVRKEKKA